MLDFQKILPYLKVDNDGLPLDKTLYHAGYAETKKIEEEIEAVFGEKYPKFLDKNRPKEKTAHKLYRREIYRNVVQQFRTKVLSMVNTIYQNDDFNVTFPNGQETNTLKDYTENGMFSNETLVEWFFAEWAKYYIDDPNAVVAPVLKKFVSNDTQFQEPKLMIVESEGVIQLNDEICVLRGDEKTWISVDDKKVKCGRNLYFYDKDSFVICKQKAKKSSKDNITNYDWEIIGQSLVMTEQGDVASFMPFLHNCGKIPALKLGRILGEKIDGEVQIYKSEVSDAIPFLKGILQRASDKEIELLLHIHSVEYYYTTKKQCNAPGCKNGYIDRNNSEDPNGIPTKVKCGNCDNQGFPINGIEYIVITLPEAGGLDSKQQQLPSGPPAGFVPRNIETVREIRAEILDEWEKAWGTINAQWIMKSPNVASGISKDYDRQEYSKREAEISLHIKKHLSNEYRWTGAIRYGLSQNVDSILPVVNVPTDNFNLFTQEEALDEYTKAIEKGMNGILTSNLAVIYSGKKFGQKSDITKRLELFTKIDPFLSISGKDKERSLMQMLFDQIKVFGFGSTKVKMLVDKIYLSINLDSILTDLINADKNFLSSTFEAQKTKIFEELTKYVPDQISEDIFKTIKQEPLTDVIGQVA